MNQLTFVRGLEPNLAETLREVEGLAVSLYEQTIFISQQIHRQYNGEIKARLLEMTPATLWFFVAHAIVSATQARADARRDAVLARAGYRVLRLNSALVMRNIEAAVALVRAALAP